MIPRLTRRALLRGSVAVGSGALLLALPDFGVLQRRFGRVLIIDEGYPTPLRETFATQGFGVYTTDLAEEGIDLGRVYDFDAVILGPRLSAQDRARLQLAFRMAKIRTPLLAA